MHNTATRVMISGKAGYFAGVDPVFDTFKFIMEDHTSVELHAKELTKVEITGKPVPASSTHMDLLFGKFNGKMEELDGGIRTLLGLDFIKNN